MTKEQIKEKKKEFKKQHKAVMQRIKEVILDAPWFLNWAMESQIGGYYYRQVVYFYNQKNFHLRECLVNTLHDYLAYKLAANNIFILSEEEMKKEIWGFVDDFLEAEKVDEKRNLEHIDTLEDSEPVKFDGDIIITDPCYVVHNDNDWQTVCDTYDLNKIGITPSMTRNTIFGDWDCETVDAETYETIGYFCADAGLVSVMPLDEVLKYNPKFDYHITRPDMVTTIRNFKGTVQFTVREFTFDFEGKTVTDHRVEIIGRGINKETGEDASFIGNPFFDDDDEEDALDEGTDTEE